MEHPQVLIDRAGCIGCGLCSRACVAHNIKMIDKKANTVLSSCLLCGQCQAVCPQKAISMTGYEDDPIEKKGEPRLDPDQVLEVIRFRRSVRRFRPTPIPQEVIGQILEAGRLTHTAKNRRIPPPSSSEDMLGGNYLIAQQLPASSPFSQAITVYIMCQIYARDFFIFFQVF